MQSPKVISRQKTRLPATHKVWGKLQNDFVFKKSNLIFSLKFKTWEETIKYKVIYASCYVDKQE